MKKQSIFAFAIFFIWLFIGAMFFMIPMIAIGIRESGLPMTEYFTNIDLVSSHSIVASCVSHLLGITVFIIMYGSLIKKDAINYKNQWLKNTLFIVIGFIMLYALTYLMGYIYFLLGFDEDDTSQNQQTIISILNSNGKIYMIIYSVILAPILEEIVFRKLFYTALRENTKLPMWAIVLIISTVFAFIHVSDIESIVYFPQYFVLALIITLSYALTKENIFVSLGLHFLNNLLGVLEILL